MSVTTIVLLSLIAAFLMLRSKRDIPTRKKKVETQVQPKKLYSSAAICMVIAPVQRLKKWVNIDSSHPKSQ